MGILHLGNYLSSGYFPLERDWRKIVNKTISGAVSEGWKAQLLNKPKLHRLARTHTKLEPLIHWEVSKRNPSKRVAIANLINLPWAYPPPPPPV